MAVAFRVATFNLENLDDRPGAEIPLASRIAILRPQLLRLRADVLCLQEVNGQRLGQGKRMGVAALDRLLAGTPYETFQRLVTESSSRGGGARDRHNLVILSRFPVLEHHQIRHDLVPPPSYRLVTALPASSEAAPVEWDRGFLHAALAVEEGATVHVVNVHLRAPRAAPVPGQKMDARRWRSVPGWAEGFFLAALKRSGQALEVRMFVDRLLDRDPQALILVCGDFNADLHQMPVRTIRGDEEDMGNGALAARVLVPVERSVSRDRRYSVLHHGRPEMVDHLLVSQTLLGWYRGAEIHNEPLGDEVVTPAVVRGAPESFHAPLVAWFETPERYG